MWNSDNNTYEPTLDIPLDDQRALFKRNRNFNQPIGNGGFKQSKTESELNDGEIRLTLPGFRQGAAFGNAVAKRAIGRDIEMASRTIPGFKWVYLQRLANPLLPWNPEPFLPDGTITPGYESGLAVNPYMTVDSMGSNMTVFTGVSPEERRVDPSNKRDPILRFRNRIPIDTLASFQRGRENDPSTPADPSSILRLQDRLAQRADNDILAEHQPSKTPPVVSMNLWNPEPIGYIDGKIAGLWMNEAGNVVNGVSNGVIGNGEHNFNGVPDHTLGFLNEPFRASTETRAPGDQTPEKPFSWLTWNNRPFANGGELLQVPAFRASQLLGAFSMRSDSMGGATVANEIYENKVPERTLGELGVPYPELIALKTDGSYGHLMNFFRTDNTDGSGTQLSLKESGVAGLHRVLDYVHVPSRFVGTETWLNPAAFGDTTTPVSGPNDPRYLRQPPFNKISSYRDPGRLNLNTVVSPMVWEGGVLHWPLQDSTNPWEPGVNDYQIDAPSAVSDGHTGPTAVQLTDSRRGYGMANDPGLQLDVSSPTFFANPFRSSDAASLVPIPSMLEKAVQCTMLRQDEFSSATVKPPLFAGEAKGTVNEFRDTDRNGYFRYQPISRLSGMTTTRSNVYAVWVTIGFFEVTESPDRDDFASSNGFGGTATVASNALYDRVYPDGYQFGKEAGSETGEIERIREFAVIDRTIPVGFEPGKNHNVDKAIRLRRRIE